MQKRRGLFRLGILLFFIWLILINLHKEKAPFQVLALASAIYFFSLCPFLIYFARQEKNIPYLPVFGSFYFVYFALSVFINYDLLLEGQVTQVIIIKCLRLALWGFISLMLAFYTPVGKIIDFMVIPLKMPWEPRKAFRVGVFLGLLGIITQYNHSHLSLLYPNYIGLFAFLSSLSRLGIAILFLLQLQDKLELSSKLFLWVVLFIPRIILDLITGATFPIILDFILLFFLYFYYHRSFPWLRLIIAGILFFIVFSIRDEFRGLTWAGGKYARASVAEKVGLYVKLISQGLSQTREKYISATYEQLAGRTDNLLTFSQVISLTPERVPYWKGYTYATLLYAFIPRFIMPEKPRKTLGQQFGHRYMFLAPQDLTTSYNLPILIEMYINFGPPAIIVGMFILGLIFRTFYNLFNHPAAGDGGFLLSAMIFTILLSIESDFSLVFGNIINYIILFYIILKLMRVQVER